MLNLIDIIFDHMHTAMVRKWGLAAVEGLNLWSTFQWANKKKNYDKYKENCNYSWPPPTWTLKPKGNEKIIPKDVRGSR